MVSVMLNARRPRHTPKTKGLGGNPVHFFVPQWRMHPETLITTPFPPIPQPSLARSSNQESDDIPFKKEIHVNHET